jgi:hypothetical protein
VSDSQPHGFSLLRQTRKHETKRSDASINVELLANHSPGSVCDGVGLVRFESLSLSCTQALASSTKITACNPSDKPRAAHCHLICQHAGKPGRAFPFTASQHFVRRAGIPRESDVSARRLSDKVPRLAGHHVEKHLLSRRSHVDKQAGCPIRACCYAARCEVVRGVCMRILSAASRKTCLSCGCRAQHWYASGYGWPSLF